MGVPVRWHLDGRADVPGGSDDAFVSDDDESAAFVLDVLVLTRRERLAREVDRVCCERGHGFMRIKFLKDLQSALAGSRPTVLLLDAGSTTRGARIAATVAAVHGELPIVLVAAGPRTRSERGFRVVDTARAGERYVDELELAYIGIPAACEGTRAYRGVHA
jgi:hypothetical protein